MRDAVFKPMLGLLAVPVDFQNRHNLVYYAVYVDGIRCMFHDMRRKHGRCDAWVTTFAVCDLDVRFFGARPMGVLKVHRSS